MSSRIEERPNYLNLFILILLPTSIGCVGKLWTYFTGNPSDTRLLIIVIGAVLFGGFRMWKLSKVNYPVPWGQSLCMLASAIYILLAIIFSAVIAFK